MFGIEDFYYSDCIFLRDVSDSDRFDIRLLSILFSGFKGISVLKANLELTLSESRLNLRSFVSY